MSTKLELGSYGFRFCEGSQEQICYLYAIGHELVTTPAYKWHGMTRTDGPLLLFQYTIEGSGTLVIDNKTYTLSAEQAFLVEIPSEHHYFFPIDAKKWEFYYVLIRPTLVDSLWAQIKQKLGSIIYLPKQSEPIKNLHNMLLEAKRAKIRDVYTASSLVYQFMMSLSAHTLQRGSSQDEWPEQIKQATDYMNNNYAHAELQEELAAKLGLSPYQFIRLFHRYVGVTPGEYLSRIKIDHAIRLLLETDLPIHHISAQLGYSSSSYFIRIFQQRLGETPAKFRKANEFTYNHIYYD